MHHFKLKVLSYIAIVLLGIITALPSLLPSNYLESAPAWYQHHKVTLGLDLRGGSHLLLHIDDKKLIADTSLQFADKLSSKLRENAISASPAKVNTDSIVVELRHSAQLSAAEQLVIDLQKDQVPRPFRVSTSDNHLLIDMSKSYRETLLADAVQRSLEVLKRRINETGVVEPLITSQGKNGILVQLPGVKDPSRIKALIGRTAQMSFHLVHEPGPDGDAATLRLADAESQQLYTLNRLALLSGGDVSDARLGFDPNTQEAVVNFRLNQHGAEIFADITKANIGRAFAVVLDDVVVTAPVIRGVIGGGSGQISGNFTSREAGDLALLLRAGSLPASLTIVEERTVGPDLGSDAIAMGVTTGLIGAALVLSFMMAAYGRWGLIANTALVVYSTLLIAALAALNATLTLPGIAGLILSLGMAVDANILINERIKEECRAAVSGRYAVQRGFERAFSTILDSNITTLIAVGLLFLFGSGPVRGFAVTMAVGLVLSMFTSIAFTRLIIDWRVNRLGRKPLNIQGLRLLNSFGKHKTIPFLKASRAGIIGSAILSLASLALLFQPGLNTGIDFNGGTVLEVRSTSTTSIDTVRQSLRSIALDNFAIQEFGEQGNFLVRLPSQTQTKSPEADIAAIKTAIATVDAQVTFPRLEMVGPSVSGEFIATSAIAVLLACGGMFIYLWSRYERYFAIGAMATLALDVTKTLGFFALTGVEFNLTAIAALLALIGYSVNDKVVVFDRIRENLRATPDKPLYELINESLTSTLNRTVFTSATTFLAILPMGIAGGSAVASFALPMLFGIVIGTSSSILIAAPIVLLLGERTMEKVKSQAQLGIKARPQSLFLNEDRP
ncbi:SecD/SecF fusion protein [Zhongshania antarctica]|uniref:Multifunctional fusion protein n=1 Tax=Zhongshania antarctica TaxID=641702 RepID=A0A840QZS8_9GAMM|nr:protein translocase subunit SecD [Zhongshania antarctica]MBB5185918.1 SecD/SecF fusion protein [Zhongshania antarctica]